MDTTIDPTGVGKFVQDFKDEATRRVTAYVLSHRLLSWKARGNIVSPRTAANLRVSLKLAKWSGCTGITATIAMMEATSAMLDLCVKDDEVMAIVHPKKPRF
ncbi:MAG: hypothetical protein Q8Q13_02695 [bacterium]|nr:hypothetical protein [bacterium]